MYPYKFLQCRLDSHQSASKLDTVWDSKWFKSDLLAQFQIIYRSPGHNLRAQQLLASYI